MGTFADFLPVRLLVWLGSSMADPVVTDTVEVPVEIINSDVPHEEQPDICGCRKIDNHSSV